LFISERQNNAAASARFAGRQTAREGGGGDVEGGAMFKSLNSESEREEKRQASLQRDQHQKGKEKTSQAH